MAVNKKILFAVIALSLDLCFLADADATSLSLACQVSGDDAHSAIKLLGTGFNGEYYAKVYSGENVEQTETKPADGNGIIEFIFHSDPDFVFNNPNTKEIAPDFIKKGQIVGSLYKAGNHTRVGGVRANCKTIKARPAASQ